jgi:hypothetical protein
MYVSTCSLYQIQLRSAKKVVLVEHESQIWTEGALSQERQTPVAVKVVSY